MKKTSAHLAAFAALAATLAFGTAQAQVSNTEGSAPGTNASTPAEIVPPSMTEPAAASGTSSAYPATTAATPGPVYHYSPEYKMPTRQEVKNETAAMVRSGLIPHGEESTAFQDRGGQIGSTPF